MSAVDDAIETLRQAMLDEGQDPGSVEAKLHAAIPNTEGNLVGNFADLQRMGAIATTGTMPTPPGEDDIETDDITQAFIEPAPPVGDNGGDTAAAGSSAEVDSRTKAELQAELDERGIAWNTGDTRADLVARLEEG